MSCLSLEKLWATKCRNAAARSNKRLMRILAGLAINMNAPWLHKSLCRTSQLGRVGCVTFVKCVVGPRSGSR